MSAFTCELHGSNITQTIPCKGCKAAKDALAESKHDRAHVNEINRPTSQERHRFEPVVIDAHNTLCRRCEMPKPNRVHHPYIAAGDAA